MKLFRCDHCSNVLYFENTVCEQCGHALGYWHATNMLVSLETEDDHFHAPALPDQRFVYCANAQHGACNWLVEYDPGGDPFCRACRHNALVPPMDDDANLDHWQVIERAKKRLFYSLLRFRLPLATRNEDAVHGLSFRFLSDEAAAQPVMTGHEDGVITLALKEADDAEREKRRTEMKEPYRTLLGHFRHEVGHYYWDLLIDNRPALEEFRGLFGDEREDYAAALQRHYETGAPADWQTTHISAYATSHPWEDWAESWAHFMHIQDALEVANNFHLVGKSIRLDSGMPDNKAGSFAGQSDFEEIIRAWAELAIVLNSLNRSMGHSDTYPFVLSTPVVNKLGFIYEVIMAGTAKSATASKP